MTPAEKAYLAKNICSWRHFERREKTVNIGNSSLLHLGVRGRNAAWVTWGSLCAIWVWLQIQRWTRPWLKAQWEMLICKQMWEVSNHEREKLLSLKAREGSREVVPSKRGSKGWRGICSAERQKREECGRPTVYFCKKKKKKVSLERSSALSCTYCLHLPLL